MKSNLHKKDGMEFNHCECECDECRGSCTKVEGHHDLKKEFNLSMFRQMEQDVWSYEEEQVKEFIKIILSKKRRYLPTKDWVVDVEDIKEAAGDTLLEER